MNLLNTWGGVTIAYRRRMIDSPSYTLNHEEVDKALQEGIRFAECLTPEEVEVDVYGQASALRLKSQSGEPVRMAAQVDSGRRGNAAQHRAGPGGPHQRFPRRQVVPGCG